MGKIFLSLVSRLLVSLFFALSACQKKSTTEQNAPSKQTSPSALTQPIAGQIQPATVSHEDGSFASYIHFPKDPAATKMESVVQFYCDISDIGRVESTYAIIGTQDAFKAAVQSALDWGRFEPARAGEKPVPVYLGGTVLFMHQNGQPVIVISLATAERERVAKFANYIQPQLIGGLRRCLEDAETHASINLPNQGASEVLVKVGDRGEITSSSIVSENPKDIGLGEFLAGAIKSAQFTPAYSDGKQTTGAINVIANFGEF
jgi:hypothetical protein